MNELITSFMSNPYQMILTLLSIVFLEIILSVDNCAAIATMVKDLPSEQRNKALKYGIIGAYVFRGLMLFFAGYVIQIWWLKPIGGLYLLWLTYSYFKSKSTEITAHSVLNNNSNWLYKITVGTLGVFWSTVVMVEFLDLSLSLDNVFAVVAFSDNIILICFGVFVGILSMRFVAQKFVILMEKYKFLETCAFIVIGLLGIKLVLSILVHYYVDFKWIESESFDWVMSGITLSIFILPLLYHKYIKKT